MSRLIKKKNKHIFHISASAVKHTHLYRYVRIAGCLVEWLVGFASVCSCVSVWVFSQQLPTTLHNAGAPQRTHTIIAFSRSLYTHTTHYLHFESGANAQNRGKNRNPVGWLASMRAQSTASPLNCVIRKKICVYGVYWKM